jgi:hypothetical protein
VNCCKKRLHEENPNRMTKYQVDGDKTITLALVEKPTRVNEAVSQFHLSKEHDNYARNNS